MQEAAAASALNGTTVVDRAIIVEQAAVAEKSKEKGAANPYAAIQAHQACTLCRVTCCPMVPCAAQAGFFQPSCGAGPFAVVVIPDAGCARQGFGGG
jgi:hypothetical protein